MKKYTDLIQDCVAHITELMPWDLEERMEANPDLLVVDVREPYEFAAMHIDGAISVPRGVLESACEWDYEETVPELVRARERELVVVCRSGYRSALAAFNMQLLGYRKVASLKTGLRGWNDYEQALVNGDGREVAIEQADEYFTPRLRPEQMGSR
jgi:rhodanese-related sulfurtransferase